MTKPTNLFLKDHVRFILLLFAGAAVFLFSTGCRGVGDESLDKERAIVAAELNEVISPLNGSSPQTGDGDLQPLDFLGQARVVGLGEATHGTKEFFQMKHRIFKYLVLHHNFKIFGFESDFGESLYIDRYITTGEGNLDDIMKNTMLFWTWRNGEVKALLQWMRDYNRDKAPEDMIHFYGVDCQFFKYKTKWLSLYLNKMSPDLANAAVPVLERIDSLDNDNVYGILTAEEYHEATERFKWLDGQITLHADDYIAKYGETEYKIIKQLIRVVIQTHIVKFNSTKGTVPGLRDKYMAENTEWLTQMHGSDTRVAVWAHNLHVGAGDLEGLQMGNQLKDALGDDYQVVGFSFYNGTFIARPEAGSPPGVCILDKTLDEESINAVFHETKYKNFILDLRDLEQGTESHRWLMLLNRPSVQIGSLFANQYVLYVNRILGRQFDVVIHFDQSTAASLIHK